MVLAIVSFAGSENEKITCRAMSQHRYRLGQAVYYQTPGRCSAAPGVYKVVGTLPEKVYRIKHPAETHERAVAETDLFPAPNDALTFASQDIIKTARPSKWE